jgi:hypothetical protein
VWWPAWCLATIGAAACLAWQVVVLIAFRTGVRTTLHVILGGTNSEGRPVITGL